MTPFPALPEKEFTSKDMIEFASWFSKDVSEIDLQEYRDHRDYLKQLEEQEYQLYLSLKAKYENK